LLSIDGTLEKASVKMKDTYLDEYMSGTLEETGAFKELYPDGIPEHEFLPGQFNLVVTPAQLDALREAVTNHTDAQKPKALLAILAMTKSLDELREVTFVTNLSSLRAASISLVKDFTSMAAADTIETVEEVGHDCGVIDSLLAGPLVLIMRTIKNLEAQTVLSSHDSDRGYVLKSAEAWLFETYTSDIMVRWMKNLAKLHTHIKEFVNVQWEGWVFSHDSKAILTNMVTEDMQPCRCQNTLWRWQCRRRQLQMFSPHK
jgi:hypothetical protein